jgi:hypothetical protein
MFLSFHLNYEHNTKKSLFAIHRHVSYLYACMCDTYTDIQYTSADATVSLESFSKMKLFIVLHQRILLVSNCLFHLKVSVLCTCPLYVYAYVYGWKIENVKCQQALQQFEGQNAYKRLCIPVYVCRMHACSLWGPVWFVWYYVMHTCLPACVLVATHINACQSNCFSFCWYMVASHRAIGETQPSRDVAQPSSDVAQPSRDVAQPSRSHLET